MISSPKPNWSTGNCAHEIQIAPPIRTLFSSTRLVVVDTQHIYGMQQFFVLADASAVSTWRPSEGGRCSGSGRWYELLVNNRHWALVLNHCRAMLLAPGPPLAASTGGWHLSPNLRPSYLSSSTDCALFGSSELGLRAAARSYPELWAFTAKVFMGCICDVIHCLLWSSRSHSH
jgi:hypothetical protein